MLLVAAFASQGQRELSPLVPTSHASRLPPSCREASFTCGGFSRLGGALATAISTPPPVGLTANLPEVWEEVPGLSVARGWVVQKELVAPGKRGWSRGEETPAEGAARCRSGLGPGDCFLSVANRINKQTLLPSHPALKLGKIQDPGAINTVVTIIG